MCNSLTRNVSTLRPSPGQVMPFWTYVDNLSQTPVIVWLALLLVSVLLLLVSVLYLRERTR